MFLFWAHYPLQVLLQTVIDPFLTATAVLTIVNSLAVFECVRTTLDEFPKQYLTAAKVCGIPPLAAIVRIQLPIVLRQLLPALLPLQVAMLHASLFASLISVEEIFRVAQRVNASVYKPVEIYTALGFFFLLITLPLNGTAALLKRYYTRSFSEI